MVDAVGASQAEVLHRLDRDTECEGLKVGLSGQSALQNASFRVTLRRMSTPISINIPHQLGRAEARRRIQTGFANIILQLPGSGSNCIERWDGDRLTFSIKGLGQSVSGVVDVLDAAVRMEIEMTGVLGLIASGLKGQLQKAGQLLLTNKQH